jgi:hypothetical protein
MTLDAFDHEDLRALNIAEREALARPIRSKQLSLVDYTPSDPNSVDRLADPGTLTVLIAPAGAPILEDVRTAAEKGNAEDIELARMIRVELSRRRRVPIPEATQALVVAPVLADLRYGGLTLASSVFLPPDYEFAAGMIPYNGGPLAADGFSLIERYQAGSVEKLDALILRATPPLSDAERAALEQLPPDETEMNLSSVVYRPCSWTTIAVAGAVAASVAVFSAIGIAAAGTFAAEAVIAATGMTIVYGARFDEPDALTEALLAAKKRLSQSGGSLESLGDEQRLLAEEAISGLGPAGTARALLMFRRDLLLQTGKQRRI